jgi:hypothetical protein
MFFRESLLSLDWLQVQAKLSGDHDSSGAAQIPRRRLIHHGRRNLLRTGTTPAGGAPALLATPAGAAPPGALAGAADAVHLLLLHREPGAVLPVGTHLSTFANVPSAKAATGKGAKMSARNQDR